MSVPLQAFISTALAQAARKAVAMANFMLAED